MSIKINVKGAGGTPALRKTWLKLSLTVSKSYWTIRVTCTVRVVLPPVPVKVPVTDIV